MNNKKLSTLLMLTVMYTTIASILYAQDTPGIEYGDNYIVFEAEATESALGQWVLREPGDAEYYAGTTVAPINETYLEFTGNTLNGGTATSPLTYTFTCPKTANYRLVMRMYQPLAAHEEGDKRNDVYVRLEGNYTSACVYPKSTLETDHKFWGRGVRVWGSCHKMEAHVSDVRTLEKVVYRLIEGEQYTLTMSGRAQGCSIDYLLLYEESLLLSVDMIDIAEANDDIYRPGLGLVDPTSLSLDPNPAEVREGTSIELDILAEPDNARKDVTWTTSNDAILTVDENGIITAVGNVGESAVITATSTVTALSATCEVTIVNWYAIPVESIILTPETINIVEGSEHKFSAKILPKYSDDPSLTWTSGNTNIATVDASGKVSALTSGAVTIYATSNVNGTIYDSAIVDIEAFVEPFVAFDDEGKYLSASYYSNGTMDVTINYHAGNFATVNDGIKFWLREIGSGWSVASETHNQVVTSVAGTTSGSVTYTIPLTGVTPTADLASGNFYFLFLTFTNSNGVKVDKGIDPIQILEGSAHIPDDTTQNSNDTTQISDNLVSVDKIQSDKFNDAITYPNPSSDGMVYINGLAKGTYKVMVYDLSGVLIVNSILRVESDNVVNLDLQNVKSGMYTILIEGSDSVLRSNIVLLNR